MADQERLADIVYELKRIEPRISDGFDKHVEYPEDLLKVLSEFFLLILQEDLELCEKIQAIIIIMMDFEKFLSDNYTLHADGYEASPRPFGSSYYYPTLEEFECFNPCKECNRACDVCDEFGEIEPVVCYYCDYEIANCQVFTCFNTYCSVTKCVKCARKDNSSGLCVDCFADMCEAEHEYMNMELIADNKTYTTYYSTKIDWCNLCGKDKKICQKSQDFGLCYWCKARFILHETTVDNCCSKCYEVKHQ